MRFRTTGDKAQLTRSSPLDGEMENGGQNGKNHGELF